LSASQLPPEHRLAPRAWLAGELERARELYQVCVAKAALPEAILPPSFYLAEWARHEGQAGDREAFERLFSQAIADAPLAPFVWLQYGRDTWDLFEDREACYVRILHLKRLLASEDWDRTNDLAPLAYAQKIETLEAWLRGEPGGTLWP
jgi:hypothetical protein